MGLTTAGSSPVFPIIKNTLFHLNIKSTTRNSYNYAINTVNRRKIQKPYNIFIKTNKIVLLLLTIFKYEGLIVFFKYHKTNWLYLRFSYIHYVTFWHNLKFYFKNKIKFTISYRMLQYFIQNTYALLYLSTTSGIISTSELDKYKKGGIILCAFYG